MGESFNALELAPRMRSALFLKTRIISVANLDRKRLVGDAGFKSGFPHMGKLPKVLSHPCLRVKCLNAEHTIFEFDDGTDVESLPKLGESVIMVPAYSDATTLLHRNIYGVRAGTVEAVY